MSDRQHVHFFFILNNARNLFFHLCGEYTGEPVWEGDKGGARWIGSCSSEAAKRFGIGLSVSQE